MRTLLLLLLPQEEWRATGTHSAVAAGGKGAGAISIDPKSGELRAADDPMARRDAAAY